MISIYGLIRDPSKNEFSGFLSISINIFLLTVSIWNKSFIINGQPNEHSLVFYWSKYFFFVFINFCNDLYACQWLLSLLSWTQIFIGNKKKMGTNKQKKNAKEIHSKTIVRFIEWKNFIQIGWIDWANRYNTFEIDLNVIEWFYVIGPYSQISAAFVMSYYDQM